MFISHPSQNKTSETLLPQTAVLDEPEPDTSDTNDVPTMMPNEDNDLPTMMPNEGEDNNDSDGFSVEILDGGSDTEIYEETELQHFLYVCGNSKKKKLCVAV